MSFGVTFLCLAILLSIMLGAFCFNPSIIDSFINLDEQSLFNEIHSISYMIVVSTFLMGIAPSFMTLGNWIRKTFIKNFNFIKENEK